jgi:hypothetical protein
MRAKWRSSLSACSSALEKGLTRGRHCQRGDFSLIDLSELPFPRAVADRLSTPATKTGFRQSITSNCDGIAKISQKSTLAADKSFRLSEEQFPPVETPTP